MKNYILSGFTALLSIFYSASAQNLPDSFPTQWKEIDSLLWKSSLPKSALIRVNALYQKATAQKNEPQVLKTLIYTQYINNQVKEEDTNTQLLYLQQAINKATSVAQKSILQVMLARAYYNIYSRNSWKFRNRTETIGDTSTDVNSWTVERFKQTIDSLYQVALAPVAVLQKTDLTRFNAVIIPGTGRYLCPTLYDFLGNIALEHYKTAYFNHYITSSPLNTPSLLTPAATFIQTSFPAIDSNSYQWKTIQLYQQLLGFHQQDTRPDAFIHLDIARIQWAKNSNDIKHNDSLYLQALYNIAQHYSDNPEAAQAYYLIAARYNKLASDYDPQKDTTNRYTKIKAKTIIDQQLAKNYPQSEGRFNMQQLLESITVPQLNTEVENINSPQLPFRLYVQYSNIPVLYGRIIRFSALNDSLDDIHINDEDSWQRLISRAPYQQFIQPLPVTNDYQTHATEIKIAALPPGRYMLITSNGSTFNNKVDRIAVQNFDVSAISFTTHRNNYFVLDRETGLPFSNTMVHLITTSLRKNVPARQTTTFITDKNGMFSIQKELSDQTRVIVYTAHDTLSFENENYYSRRYNATPANKTNVEVLFFTDRGIYRPGQTVHFKGIATNNSGTPVRKSIYQGKDSIRVTLLNANSIATDSLQFTVNEYGSFAGSFVLPQNEKTGDFTITAGSRIRNSNLNGSVSFQVEEYKRPKFYIEFDTLKSAYRLNDSITISGYAKTYAGTQVGGAKVAVTINRNAQFNYPWLFYRTSMPESANETVAYGTTTTKADGSFRFTFRATPDSSIAPSTLPVFQFTTEVAITDNSGETRENNTTIPVGYQSLQVNLAVPTNSTTKAFTHVAVTLQNLSGQPVPAPVQIKVYPLQTPERLIRKRYWEAADQFVMNYEEYVAAFPHDEYGRETDYHTWIRKAAVVSGTWQQSASNLKGFALPKSLAQGWYVIEAQALDINGDTLKDLAWIEVVDLQNDQLPANEYNWNYTPLDILYKGDTARLYTGSGATNVFVIQHAAYNGIPDSTYTTYQVNHEKKQVLKPITQAAEGAIGISYAFICNNRLYVGTFNTIIQKRGKRLQINYQTYRNKILPGSRETWSVQVRGEQNEKVPAELLTAMYDASLDQFSQHYWQLPDTPIPFYNYYWNSGYKNFNAGNSQNIYLPEKEFSYTSITKDYLLSPDNLPDRSYTFDYSYNGNGNLQRKDRLMASANFSLAAPSAAGKVELAKAIPPSIVKEEAEIKQDVTGAVSQITNSAEKTVQVRKNFNETAFFFPQLYADTSGTYTFSFTMPESLTTWKWLSLAHTKQLALGLTSTTVISQKVLMAQVNAPRFVRQGDAISLTATISNLDSTAANGQVQLELIDAVTNQPVNELFQHTKTKQSFSIQQGASQTVFFPVIVPTNFMHPVTYRIVAQAGNFSDGEENVIPVLPNRMLVTETLPLLLKGNTTRQFTLSKLANNSSNTLTTESVTVEYTTNPVWQAIQALPYLVEYPYECAEQTFNRFYANALAAFIVNKHPQIKTAFELWKKDSTALQSNLQKNEELKQILLEETPWVLNAANEAQQKKNIALLFDVVTMASKSDAALQQLQEMQFTDGSFSWFKGGYTDRYITNYIATGIGKLIQLKAVPANAAKTLQSIGEKAIQYLDNRMYKDFLSWKITTKNVAFSHLSNDGIQYLFARSYFKDVAFSNKAAWQFLLQQAAKHWNKQNNYNKALLGVVLYRNNQQKLATGSILPSILENAVEDSSKGMYWKDRTTCFWHPAAIEHQASIMTLTAELSNQYATAITANAYKEMRNWLILNKQTSNWGSTIATADACYALLLKPDLLQTVKQVTIQLGNTVLQSNTETQQAGSGYFKERIDGSQVTPATGRITITTHSTINPTNQSDVSYGAVYWQYFENMDKITTSTGNPLSVAKKWFIEKQTDKGAVLEAITTNSRLKAGDKVVIQIVLKSDRNMDYVHIKDMRAATMEPVNVLSSYKWQDGLGYYEATKDASTNFFIDHLQKGTYVFNYPVYITNSGTFTSGIATAQCMYAPEFSSHSEGIQLIVP
ncbi:Alpha-2-macroglobulin family protein [Filimonas lacunae]|uniref:Alpha-2-macroglobulin family protein n=1 Tax=Filimonas lacunae TaxID=477680 RepID=A0A1N7KI36_9BACT|nr:alpha-2-macroglobulin family protein [Filimonas lacunae]SIS61255.1 Alpha-2-macroglobulin family protein [Filimonas lacunae]